MSQNLSKFIKTKRKALKLTQLDLSDKAGVGIRFIRELEAGKRTVRLDKINQVLDLFGYELRYKFVGLADEVAAAAELVMGQGTEQVPVAVVRGLNRVIRTQAHGLSRKLQLGKQADLFTKTK